MAEIPDVIPEEPTTDSIAEKVEPSDDGVKAPSNAARLKSSFVPAVLSNAVETVAGIGGAAVQSVSKHGFRDHQLKDAVRKARGGKSAEEESSPTHELESKDEHEHAVKGEEGLRGQRTVEDTQELGELEKGMREQLEGLELKEKLDVGEEVRKAAKERNKDVKSVLGGSGGVGCATTHDGQETERSFSLKPAVTGLHSVEEPVFKELPLPDFPQTPSVEQTGGQSA